MNCAICGEQSQTHKCPRAALREVSAAADAACPRVIIILSPDFKLPVGFHMGAANRSSQAYRR